MFFALIAGVVAITFIKYFVAKDYYITAQANCDPTTAKCFIWKCDPNATDGSEKCTGDSEKDTWYYQDVKKIANQIPLCDLNDDNCKALECDPGMDCTVTLCDDVTKKEEGVDCNDPDEYNKENPPTSDEQACAPDDQSCVNADEPDSADNSATDDSAGSTDGNSASGASDNSTSP